MAMDKFVVQICIHMDKVYGCILSVNVEQIKTFVYCTYNPLLGNELFQLVSSLMYMIYDNSINTNYWMAINVKKCISSFVLNIYAQEVLA